MASVYDLALISQAVYDTDGGKIARSVQGFTAQKPPFGNANKGFYAVEFTSGKTADVILGIRGTDPGQVNTDIWADIQLAMGSVPYQYEQAEKALRSILTRYKNRPIYVTGHSLGGGLASMLGALYKLPVVTFNAPGMHNSVSSKLSGTSPTAIALTASSSAYPGAMPVYTPALMQQLEAQKKAQATVAALNKSQMLNIRASSDVVSVGTGPAIGPVEAISVPNPPVGVSWDDWVLTGALGLWGLLYRPAKVSAINTFNQHSIDSVVKALAALPKYHNDLRWGVVAPPKPAQPSNAGPKATYYDVVANDSLSKIALKYYRDPAKWTVIYQHPQNKALIGGNPALIKVGMRLVIP